MISIDKFASTKPVRLLIVNTYKNPVAHKQVALYVNCDMYIVESHLKILILLVQQRAMT